MDPPADSRAKSALPVRSAAKSFNSSRTMAKILESSTTTLAEGGGMEATAAAEEDDAISLHKGEKVKEATKDEMGKINL